MQKFVKIYGMIVLFIVLTVMSFAGTYAYLVRTDNLVNSLFVGENRIEVTEEFDRPGKVTPGISFHKMPYVTNTGNLDCFVRCRVDFSSSDAGRNNNEGGYSTLDYNTTDWTYNPNDGYWYYNYILKPDESTKDHALFTTVTISDTADEKKMTDFDIYVYTESYQAGNHSADDYMSSDIWGAME